MNYELVPRLRHLTLTGQDDDGDLEFVGNQKQWTQVKTDEMRAIWNVEK